jgi:phosphopantetheinyl transferase
VSTLRLSIAKIEPALARVDARPSFEAGPGDDAPPWFGTSELARWATLPVRARPAFLASRHLLRRLLEEATGIDRNAWQVSAPSGAPPAAILAAARIGSTGRRRIESPPGAGLPRVSLSHRLGHVAAAVLDTGDAGGIGIDLECERPARTHANDRAALMMSPDELGAWRGLPELVREAALLCTWVVKEAWFKASAEGAAVWDFRRVAAVACEPADANVRLWRSPPLVVAVCCHDVDALACATCEGLPPGQPAESSFWHVRSLDTPADAATARSIRS